MRLETPPKMVQLNVATVVTVCLVLFACPSDALEKVDINSQLKGLEIDPTLKTIIGTMWTEIDELKERVDRCESQDKEVEKTPYTRRQTQEQSTVCGAEAVQSMLHVCCASQSPINGHRLQEIEGCDTLPPTCSLQCSSQFISIFENLIEKSSVFKNSNLIEVILPYSIHWK